MLFRKGILTFVALIALFLTGCALSPQQLTPTPVILGDLPVTGQGRAINVNVVDGRKSDVLGSRGGVYSNTSNITVPKAFITQTLQKQTEDALRKMGYVPQTNNPSAPSLTITLSDLSYKTTDGYVSDTVDVNAALRTTLTTSSKVYNGQYTANATRSFSSSPDLETNNALVADVLARALKRLLTDNNLTGNL